VNLSFLSRNFINNSTTSCFTLNTSRKLRSHLLDFAFVSLCRGWMFLFYACMLASMLNTCYRF
jgi:hypothetical protein